MTDINLRAVLLQITTGLISAQIDTAPRLGMLSFVETRRRRCKVTCLTWPNSTNPLLRPPRVSMPVSSFDRDNQSVYHMRSSELMLCSETPLYPSKPRDRSRQLEPVPAHSQPRIRDIPACRRKHFTQGAGDCCTDGGGTMACDKQCEPRDFGSERSPGEKSRRSCIPDRGNGNYP